MDTEEMDSNTARNIGNYTPIDKSHILEGVHIQRLFCANTSKYTTFYNTPRGSANFTHMRNKNNLTLNERHENSRPC